MRARMNEEISSSGPFATAPHCASYPQVYLLSGQMRPCAMSIALATVINPAPATTSDYIETRRSYRS